MDIVSYIEARKARQKAEDVQNQLNLAISEGDQLVEVQQARLDADGVAYDTLKQRLDAEQLKKSIGIVPRANRVGFMGDSNTDGRFQGRPTTEVIMPTWASMASIMSEQRIFHGLNSAVSGYTTKSGAGVLSDRVIADNPSKCIIMLGTNDIGEVDPTVNFPSDSMSNIRQIANRLTGAGIEPIFMTVYPITPGSTLGGKEVVDPLNRVNLFNQFIKSFCVERGYKCLDPYSVLLDPATGGINTKSNDGVHSGTFLATWVAEYVVQQLAPHMPAWHPQLSEFNNDPTNLLTNGLFMDGTDGWTQTGSSWTVTTEDAMAGFGKFITFTASPYQSTGVTLSQTITEGFDVGDVISIGGRIRARIGNESGSIYSCKLLFSGATPSLYSPLFQFKTTLEGMFYQEYVVPENTASITVEIGTESGIGKVQFGQLTLRNLTALGVV